LLARRYVCQLRNCGSQNFEIDCFCFRITNGIFSKLGRCGIALDNRELLVDRYGKPGGSIYETVQYWTGESRCGQAKEDNHPKHKDQHVRWSEPLETDDGMPNREHKPNGPVSGKILTRCRRWEWRRSKRNALGHCEGVLMRPYRFQRKRTRGWRKPHEGVCCDRSSRWGNPFDWRVLGREGAVHEYERALLEGALPFTVADVRLALSGRPLGCYCRLDEPCHVEVLLQIANRPS
jgi:hypothetical protein